MEPTDLYNAVHGKGDPVPQPGSLFHCVTYWARGSIGIVFQLVMALISAFGLEEKVRGRICRCVLTWGQMVYLYNTGFC